MNKTPLTKRGRPKPENFENAVIRGTLSTAVFEKETVNAAALSTI